MQYIRLLLPTLVLFVSSCGNNPVIEDYTAYKAALLEERKQKDNEFAAGKNSPFASLEEEFTGLKYFDPDPNYRVEAIFHKIPMDNIREIQDSKGGIRKYKNVGQLTFKMGLEEYQLPAFLEEHDSEILFIMFKDKTNKNSTYYGGRYIEMVYHKDDDKYIIDFNKAFNPYCHYNYQYSCPVVPKDCYLNLEIKAGEKKYKD